MIQGDSDNIFAVISAVIDIFMMTVCTDLFLSNPLLIVMKYSFLDNKYLQFRLSEFHSAFHCPLIFLRNKN